MFEVHSIDPSNKDLYLQHTVRLINESGTGDTPHFSATHPDQFLIKNKDLHKNWALDLTELGWVRTWVVFDKDKIIASISLDGSKNSASNHRVLMQMGIETGYKRQGLGQKLLEQAISWAKSNDFVWVDLGVFSSNTPGIKLYEKFGFKEYGRCVDNFRFESNSVDLILMAHNTA